MLPSPRLVGRKAARFPEAPCTTCLLDLAESSGMAGGGACLLKGALLRRLADRRISAPSCDAYLPGFADDGAEDATSVDAMPGRRLS